MSKSFFHSRTPALQCSYLPGNTFIASSSLHWVCVHAHPPRSLRGQRSHAYLISVCSFRVERDESSYNKGANYCTQNFFVPQCIPVERLETHVLHMYYACTTYVYIQCMPIIRVWVPGSPVCQLFGSGSLGPQVLGPRIPGSTEYSVPDQVGIKEQRKCQ